MTNRELEQFLKTTTPPSRTDEYWQAFPESVVRQIKGSQGPASCAGQGQTPGGHLLWKLCFATFGLAALAVGVVWFRPNAGKAPGSDLQILRTYYREMESLFPRQFESVVFDRDEVHLRLSDRPDVPNSPPLYVRVCAPGPSSGCVSAITFSGQKLRVLGREFEVLADGKGQIFFLAKEAAWNPGEEPMGGGWRFESGWLERPL